jgi:hypothetical protein
MWKQDPLLLLNLKSNHIISKETYEAVAFVRTKVDLNNDEIYKQVVGDFDSYSFSNPNDDDATVLGVRSHLTLP